MVEVEEWRSLYLSIGRSREGDFEARLRFMFVFMMYVLLWVLENEYSPYQSVSCRIGADPRPKLAYLFLIGLDKAELVQLFSDRMSNVPLCAFLERTLRCNSLGKGEKTRLTDRGKDAFNSV